MRSGKAVNLNSAFRNGRAAVVVCLAGTVYFTSCAMPAKRSDESANAAAPRVAPLWYQADGRDNPVSVENDTPFPDSQLIVNAQWATPRYYPNRNVQEADIIPVTWADDGNSYVMMDDGLVHEIGGTTLLARLEGVPPSDGSVPHIDFHLIAHDVFLYGCPKSWTEKSCYSVGLTQVDHTFYAPTYDHGYQLPGNNFRGHARIDYSPTPLSQTSWVHGTVDFPDAVGSGVLSFVEIGQGAPAHDGCSSAAFPRGCIYAIVSEGGLQDPKDPIEMDQFIATKLYLARMTVGTPEHQFQEVTNPLNWQWFAGFDRADRPTWLSGADKELARRIRSLSFPRQGRSGCGVDTEPCFFWDQTPGQAGHVNYPRMTYDAALDRYFLTFADYYYRDVQPPAVPGPLIKGGVELLIMEAPHPWGPWSFVARGPYLGSGNAYDPSFPVEWQGPRKTTGQDLWMIWAANFGGACGTPLLVPADLCQGVYGMNLRRLHFTVAGTPGALPRPWYDQDVGFASPGSAKLEAGVFELVGNGNLALRPDPFEQYKDYLDHDAFHYVFQRASGDGELVAQLFSGRAGTDSGAGQEASAGLMVRESSYVIGQTDGPLHGRQLSPGDTFSEAARYAYVGVLKDGSAMFQWRDDGRVSRSRTQSQTCPSVCLLKIIRHANQVSAFISVSHGAWRDVGGLTFSTPLARSVTMGLVATSDSPSTFPQYASHSARFLHVRFRSSH